MFNSAIFIGIVVLNSLFLGPQPSPGNGQSRHRLSGRGFLVLQSNCKLDLWSALGRSSRICLKDFCCSGIAQYSHNKTEIKDACKIRMN